MRGSPTHGRTNTESQTAAISRVVAFSPQRKAIIEALGNLIASPAFKSSRRAQIFLRYVVEHALDGELDLLKERVIGSVLFGREPDYDTGTDSVVRVAATEVRKRLQMHYGQAPSDEPVLIELPTGSYIPEIHLKNTERNAPQAAEMAPEVVPPLPAPPSRWRLAAIAGWSVAIMIGLLWTGSTRFRPMAEERTLRYLPWTALFNGGTPQLILADGGLGVLRYLSWFPVVLSDYADRRFLVPPPGLSPEFHGVWEQLAPKHQTSIVDARIAAAFTSLAVATGHKPVIRFARDLQLSDFRLGDNLILLGSSGSNPWVELFQDQLDFQISQVEQARGFTVTVRHPKPGDPTFLATQVSSGTTGAAYATLALVKGLDGRGSVLIAQGTNMEGTDIAGNLAITRPEELAAELRRCGIEPTNPLAHFEILLRLDATAGSARSSSVLATRCRANR